VFAATLLRCNLKGAKLDAVTFEGTRVGGCNFDDSEWEQGNVYDDTGFADCSFKDVSFYKTSIQRASFTRCAFTDALWEGVTVLQVFFEDVDFTGLSIVGDYEVEDIVLKGPTIGPGVSNSEGEAEEEAERTRGILERASGDPKEIAQRQGWKSLWR